MLRPLAFSQSVVDSIPEEVLERLPEDVHQHLEDGVIDKIPGEHRRQAAGGAAGFGAAGSDRGRLLESPVRPDRRAGAGRLTFGLAKSAIKAAVFFAAAAVLAWFSFVK